MVLNDSENLDECGLSMDMGVSGEVTTKLKGCFNSKLRNLGKKSSGFKKDVGSLVDSNGGMGRSLFANDYRYVGSLKEGKKSVGRISKVVSGPQIHRTKKQKNMGSEKQGFIWLSGLLFLNILALSTAEVLYYEFFVSSLLSFPPSLFLQESQFTKLCSTKSILTVNGSFPGPEIRVRRGDTVFVNVHNQGNHAVSLKWEGVKDSIDGSNELIQPGRNFTYEIELEDEIGTLWWHATSAWAAATVHGAFVILPAANEDYPFPAPTSDQTIILGEWFREELTEANQTIAPGSADAYTINGHPGETYGCSNDTTYEMQVDYEGLYLVRVINAIANETMVFGVASHSFTIVGQSGDYSRRSFTNSLTLAPAQVVDVLLCANQNVGHYYITARPSSGAHITNGILRYTTTSSLI
ncbi:hypothetical protein Gotri_010728 [Gossypium trilobum]|uniref:Plastocyanin-like domain-containing protein n=1 Tax=Gossypium trilobum TaxID=34281 RepID=A0A7J9ERH2_9ROSI|nr:hypothetical protein [Gossypium trilobum]